MIDISQGLYRAVLAIVATANRVITFPDRTFTVADNADLAVTTGALAAHAALTDTAHGGTAWAPYTPTWSGGVSAIGNAVVSARWRQIGKTVHVSLIVTFGTTTTFAAAAMRATLPVPAVASPVAFGVVQYYDASAVDLRFGSIWMASTTTIGFRLNAVFDLTSTLPWTWDDPDIIACSFTYEAA